LFALTTYEDPRVVDSVINKNEFRFAISNFVIVRRVFAMSNSRRDVKPLSMWLGVLCAAVSWGACQSESSTSSVPLSVSQPPAAGNSRPQPDPANVTTLGEFRATWNATTQSLSFQPKETAPSSSSAATPGVRPQGFAQIANSANGFTTSVLSSIVGPNTLFNNSAGCASNWLCAVVQVANTVSPSRTVDSIYVIVTSIDSGFAVSNSDVARTGYPFTCTSPLGCWEYGLVTNGQSKALQWDFSLPNSNDFSFDIKIMGTFLRSSYGCSATDITTSAYVDACGMSGATTILTSATPGAVVGPIALPFPYTLYDSTFDSSGVNLDLFINTNGALGFNEPANSANVDIPDTSGSYDYTLFPYWDEIATSTSGVCYATSGTTPNRLFTVTWKDADLNAVSGAQALTFSAVLYESSDQVDYVYNYWKSTSGSSCASSSATRGTSATFGIQGADLGAGVLGTKLSYNAAYLPVRNAVNCNGRKVTCTATVISP